MAEFDLKAMSDKEIAAIPEEEFEAQLRQRYGIDVETPDSAFLYVPKGKPKSERKFPVKSKKNGKWVINKRLVRAALTRFHQTSPEVQRAIKGRLSALARRFGFNPPGSKKDEEERASFEAAFGELEEAYHAYLE